MQLSSHLLSKLKETLNQKNDSLIHFTWPLDSDFYCLQVAAQSNVEKIIYFSKPKQTKEYLAFGAWRILNNKELKQTLDLNNSDTRWFGINAFSSESKKITEYWVLPKVWFEKSNDSVHLNIVIDIEKNSKDTCLNSILDVLEKIDTTLNLLKIRYM